MNHGDPLSIAPPAAPTPPAGASWPRRGAAELRALFAVDPRVLGLTRIAVGLVVLGDLASRARDLGAHYTDEGVLPRALLNDPGLASLGLSAHALTGRVAPTALVFAAHALVATLLALGWRTRLTSVVCWVFWLSLFERNPYVCDGGDRLVGLTLLWGALSPWGARFSLDALRRPASKPDRVLTPASLALLAQMPLVYVVTGFAKSGADWTSDFTAVHHALRSANTLVGSWLLAMPAGVTAALTALTLVAERYVPLLLLSPFKPDLVRRWVFAALAALQVGIFVAVYRSQFALISVAAMLPWLPPSTLDGPRAHALVTRVEALARRLIAPRAYAAPASWRATWIAGAVAALLMCVSIDTTYTHLLGPWANRPARALWSFARLSQRWEMYAPRPRHSTSFVVVVAHLADGRERDAISDGAALTWERPREATHTFARQRWIGYLLTLRESSDTRRRRAFARYLCRRWNLTHRGTERAQRVVARVVTSQHFEGMRSGPRQFRVWADEPCEQ